MNDIAIVTAAKSEINKQLADKETFATLLSTTFKGLEASTAKRAILEGVLRGFEFKDFLEKNIYAIPFKGTYSLVTSIDYARKVGMRSGIVGKSEPIFEMNEDGKKIVSCSITVKKKLDEYVGDFTAKVYFDEYTTGRNLWTSKPRTMIAKVAEMHALRMACPEELSQAYVEEETQSEVVHEKVVDLGAYEEKLKAATSIEELKTAWANTPVEVKTALKPLQEQLKAKYAGS